ncbi:MAG: PilT/PilU family type 4a pilus ATPase, partial [Lentisphaeraceae bacterium]|nr:PilT/PilU family type 4a pilus ATPase [Lentisphaeraceae bacterium]
MTIINLLKELQNEAVSDLFLNENKTPYVRRLSKLENFGNELIKRDDFKSFFENYLPKESFDKLMINRDLDLGLSLSSTERFRLNFGFEQGNITMVARKVPSGAVSFNDLDLPPIVEKLAQEARGIILITGATGSGKSTTMAALLHYMNNNYQRHIVTLEDPIEFVHIENKCHITQREIGNDTKDFSTALRHVVRQSPDVIFIGEMRDLETIRTALTAAMTGHLVISTLHTVDTEQTLERILNYFPADMQAQVALDLSIALKGIISQRLLPTKDGRGLIPAVEVLVNTPIVARKIAHQKVEEIGEALKAGAGDGMQMFSRALRQLVVDNKISAETAINASGHPEEMKLLLEGMETGIDTLRSKLSDKLEGGVSMQKLLSAALFYKASDMLLSVGNAPVLRIDGKLLEMNQASLSGADTRTLLFSVLSRRQRAEFEQNKEIDFALSISVPKGDKTDETRRFRVNGFFQKGAISCAMRVINDTIPTPLELGLPLVVSDLADKTYGLVLITGPTGHGKSTTLASIIDKINTSRSCHIITVEDPIEYVHQSKKAIIEQRELHADTLSFNNALKYILRQDPDVILIGEMRDPETIAAALTAAETGHLVLATLHTNNAIQSVDRIIDSFPAHQQNQVRAQLSACLLAIIAQRLLPRKDNNGRVAVFEILTGNIGVKALIRDAKTHQIPAIMEASSRDGMITMDRA